MLGKGLPWARLTKMGKKVEEQIDQSTVSSDSSRHSLDYFDALKAFPRSRQASDEEDSGRLSASSLSAPLSILLISSLKEAVADDSEGSLVRAVTNSFQDMERLKPGSFEVLVSRMLQRLASSKESSLNDMQDLATQIFTKGRTVPEQTQNVNAEIDSRKKRQNKEAHSNPNLSPRAGFLISS